MTQTSPGGRSRSWADPVWWAQWQLELMTATATYLTRVAQAYAGAIIPAPSQSPEAGTPEPTAPEPMAPEPTAPEPMTAEPAAAEPAAAEIELPVARWAELSLGSIRARLSRLSEADLVTLHAYEEQHSSRPEVLSMLANRLIRIRQADGPADLTD